MGREKAKHPRRKKHGPGYPTNLYRDVPESCLRMSMQIAGVADPSNDLQLAAARRGTHDIAIARAGAARVSGVEWRQPPPADAPGVLAALILSLKAELDEAGREGSHDLKVYEQLLAFVEATPGATIVIGYCWVDTRIRHARQS